MTGPLSGPDHVAAAAGLLEQSESLLNTTASDFGLSMASVMQQQAATHVRLAELAYRVETGGGHDRAWDAVFAIRRSADWEGEA